MNEIDERIIEGLCLVYDINRSSLRRKQVTHKVQAARDAMFFYLCVLYNRPPSYCAALFGINARRVVPIAVNRHIARTQKARVFTFD